MTDEELKAYADKHWKNVVLCSECNHLMFTVARYNWCKLLKTYVKDDFWCRNGERRNEHLR